MADFKRQRFSFWFMPINRRNLTNTSNHKSHTNANSCRRCCSLHIPTADGFLGRASSTHRTTSNVTLQHFYTLSYNIFSMRCVKTHNNGPSTCISKHKSRKLHDNTVSNVHQSLDSKHQSIFFMCVDKILEVPR